MRLHEIVFALQKECAESAVLAVAEELRETEEVVGEGDAQVPATAAPGGTAGAGDAARNASLANSADRDGDQLDGSVADTASPQRVLDASEKVLATLASELANVSPQQHRLIAPPLSDARLEQFRADLEALETNASSDYILTVRDFRAVLPALACAAHAPLPRLPQRARCVLLRALRRFVEDQHLDGNRTTPGAFFEFPDTRTGVIQLAPIPGAIWRSLHVRWCMGVVPASGLGHRVVFEIDDDAFVVVAHQQHHEHQHQHQHQQRQAASPQDASLQHEPRVLSVSRHACAKRQATGALGP